MARFAAYLSVFSERRRGAVSLAVTGFFGCVLPGGNGSEIFGRYFRFGNVSALRLTLYHKHLLDYFRDLPELMKRQSLRKLEAKCFAVAM